MKHMLLAILFLGSCTSINAQNKKLNKLRWIQGEWIMPKGEIKFIEYWDIAGNEEWQGIGYGINTIGDTVFKEHLQIAIQSDTVWYLPTIANQNDGKQVRFAAIELTDKKAVFENKQHDFPQRIVYNKTSDSTIYAYVEGIQKGKMRKEEFYFKRKK